MATESPPDCSTHKVLMRVKIFYLAVALFPIVAHSQRIQWIENLSWNEVKEKAKKERKMVFVDCYATWCVPCKKMDREVYINDSVGQHMNANFISLKVQFDKTANDAAEVKKWYGDAEAIQKQFLLDGYPSFLFFDTVGRLVMKQVGYRNVKAFVKMAIEASDPSRMMFYQLLDHYERGIKDYGTMLELVDGARELLGDSKLSEIIAKDYKTNYLDKVSEEELLTEENLRFIGQRTNILRSGDALFKLIFSRQGRVDTLTNFKHFAFKVIKNVVEREELNEKLYGVDSISMNEPDWGTIHNTITKKYNVQIADALIPGAQLSFYIKTKNWEKYTIQINGFIKRYSPKKGGNQFSNAVGNDYSDDWALNICAWNMFLNCENQSVLQTAVQWSDLSILINSAGSLDQYYDTKANLMYKLAFLFKIGKVEDAIVVQQNAISALPLNSNAAKLALQGRLDKMIRRVPTWK